MPPKRKATTTLPGGSPSKRLARLTTPEPEIEPSEIGAPSKPRISTTPAVTPRRKVITYSGRRASARKAERSVESLKENGKDDEDAEESDESSVDELDCLSPSKRATRRTTKPSLIDGSPDPPPTPVTRTRSAKLLDTPTPSPVKSTAKSPAKSSPTKPPTKSPTKSTTKSPTKSPVKGKGEATSTNVASDAEEPIKNLSVRVTRRSTTATNGTLHATTQVAKSKLASSPKKKPLTVTKDENIELRAKASSPRKPAKRVEATTDPFEETRTPTPPLEPPTPLRAPTKRLPNLDSDRLPTPLRFDSVTIPLAPTVSKASSVVRNVSRSATPQMAPTPLSRSVTPPPVTPRISPSKRKPTAVSSPTRILHELPPHLHTCLNAQKRAILFSLQNLPDIADDDDDNDDDRGEDDDNDDDRGEDEDVEPSTNSVAAEQLRSLLDGTVSRGEGNSCLVLGARGSGKSRLVEECISSFSAENPLIFRLSGWTQHSDRLAMREIAYQLNQQTGTSFLADTEDEPSGDATGTDAEEVNPFIDVPQSIQDTNLSLPPSSHLPALIGVLPTLSRPSIVILDGFDLFALHPRQSLLYCLFDTAQSCRAAAGTKGIAVIGVTSRIDTITTLEKRVKSRFSGRMLRTAPPRTLQVWEKIARAALSVDITEFMVDAPEEEGAAAVWQGIWDSVVEQFLTDKTVQKVMNETFSVTRDVRMLSKLLVSVALRLSQDSAILSASQFAAAALAQRARPRFPLLHALPYPSVCLLIASVHADTAGQANFTFEMLHEYFRDQVRASTSAPVQVNGGSIGMVRCSRQVLMAAFEDLIATRVFVPVAAYAPSVAREFVKYRSVVDREDIKKAVDKMSQVNLKKWLTRAQ